MAQELEAAVLKSCSNHIVLQKKSRDLSKPSVKIKGYCLKKKKPLLGGADEMV